MVGCALPPGDQALSENGGRASPTNEPARLADDESIDSDNGEEVVASDAPEKAEPGELEEVLAHGRRRGLLTGDAEQQLREELAPIPVAWKPHIAAARLAVLERGLAAPKAAA
ncbi:MAG: hypothetical protein WD176_05995, partial [Pirellulales bacterium]